ncbi:hypothetical protein NAT51_09045 [Flavobacterium amniphilum]|uniref:hypothetical protein n=1 Tax=Flavobacterium amniphilum TaxID=1834035 RepID=UPI002029E277|nr:hypothetical protein [Flavobacterium amniphilum]MCL9805668.1 hypothetical protein [Flavobacterium amniphilum]
MVRKITFLFASLLSFVGFSQVGIGTITPNSDAALEIFSTNSGVLISRIPLVSTSASSPLSGHVAGMIVYNTASSGAGNTKVEPGFYYSNGSQWIRLEPLTTGIGDVKQSILTQDHNGWYLLNGRTVASLPVNAAANALLVGFATNLPDATDCFLKGKSGLESLSATGGNNSRALTQANLPNVTFNGTAASAGGHTHDYDDKYHGVTENLNIVTGLLGILSGVVLNILNNDVGSPTVTSTSATSTVNGSHNHTSSVSTGGSSAVLPTASHMVTNTFVYLGK